LVGLLSLVAALLYAIHALLDSTGPVDPALYLATLGLILCAVFIVAWRARRHGLGRRPTRVDDWLAAEALVLRDDFDGAVARIQRALAVAPTRWRQVALLGLLGRCAEGRGDFPEAADVFGRAEEMIPTRRGAYAQLGPVLAAHRAFALAATGKLDDATRALERAGGRQAYPRTRALAARARALVLARRGERQALSQHLDETRVVVKSSLGHRDRTLLRVLGESARWGLAGQIRGGVPSGLRVDAETRAWITRAAPDTAAFLEQLA
jgi:tetratricopeptide (TPR) repeat protein